MLNADQILNAGSKIQDRRMQEAKEKYCTRFGYDRNGYTYILLESLSNLDRRKAFKSMGGLYDKFLGWHCSHRVEGFEMRRASMKDIATFDHGRWWTMKNKVDEFRREKCRVILTKRDAKSEFVGDVLHGEVISTSVRLVSCEETAYRDNMWGIPNYYALPYRWDYRFADREGNILLFSSAYYIPEKVKEWFNGGWARVKAKVVRHDSSYGVKITRIMYPEMSRRGKPSLSEYAKVKSPGKMLCQTNCETSNNAVG